MTTNIKIALTGKSGSGKTEVANYLEKNYGFVVVNVGQRVRELASEFFDSNSKDILQKITDAFNSIERGIWLKISLKRFYAGETNLVIDNIRFKEDYDFVVKNSFAVWRIESSFEMRLERLSKRQQPYNIQNENHQSENELDNLFFDATIINTTNNLSQLHTLIKTELQKKHITPLS